MTEDAEVIVYPAVRLSAGTHTIGIYWPRTDVGRPVMWLDGEPLPDLYDDDDPYEETE